MKVVLTILAGLIIVFAGGCAVMLQSLGVGLELIPGILVVLNVLVILAIWRNFRAGVWVLLVLGIVDLILALGILITFGAPAYGYSTEVSFAGLLAAAFGAKGVLSLVFFKQLRSTSSSDDQESPDLKK